MSELENGPGPQPVHLKWYRSSLFNACIIGTVGFLAPGMWNAMSSLGAGGEEKPFLIDAANALVFALMGIFSVCGGPIANRIGLRWTLVLGAVGYPVYAAGLYTNKRWGVVWLVLLGSVFCGISAGLFWASEGAIALGYPEPSKKARYLNIWVWFRTMGPIVGGAIVLGLNIKTSGKGSVSPSTYIVFIVLQCLAVPVAFLLTSPEKVQRGDGSPVIIHREATWAAEFRALYRTSSTRNVLLLLPVFWAVYFNQYTGNYETYYFTVRARAVIGFVVNFATLLASQLMSLWLDNRRVPARTRIRWGFYYVVFLHVVTWIYAWVVQSQFARSDPTLDYTSHDFTKGFFVLLLWNFAFQSAQNWLYYLVASMTDNISELTRLTGILRGQESFGEAVGYGLNTRDWYGGRVPMAVNTILLVLCVLPTWLVVRSHDSDKYLFPSAAATQNPDGGEEKSNELKVLPGGNADADTSEIVGPEVEVPEEQREVFAKLRAQVPNQAAL